MPVNRWEEERQHHCGEQGFGQGGTRERQQSFGQGEKELQRGRSAQREVACECWFTSTGKIIPLLLKIRDEDGEIRTIRQIIVHRSEQKLYAGIPFLEYDCTLVILEQKIRVKLLYYQAEGRWRVEM